MMKILTNESGGIHSMGEINEGCGKKLESKLTQERRLRDMA